MRRMVRAGVMALAACATATSCIRGPVATPGEPPSMCAARTSDVRWIRIAPLNETATLDQWCAGVGPPLIVQPTPAARSSISSSRLTIAIVSWNTHVGAGDIDGFVDDLVAGRLTAGTVPDDYVLLLQETYRADRDVPAVLGTTRSASAQAPRRAAGAREDIGVTARRLGLHALYVPSMRNGAATDEDRGNAILSTRPLSRLTAIELPMERQRRVAVSAVINIGPDEDHSLALRIVSAHFSNFVAHHLWVLSEPARVRQARALAQILRDDEPTALGGDFNSWFGYADAAYRTMTHVLPGPRPADRRPTFTGMRLDHLMFRLPHGWRATTRRAEHRYGSDHYPLVALVRMR
jgi:endonuclease/exonuclease/phosphatase family metal-dependent hydrolase